MSSPELGIERPINPDAQYFLDLAQISDPVFFAFQKAEVDSLLIYLESLPPTKHIPSEVVAYACRLSVVTRTPFVLIEQHETARRKATMYFFSRQEAFSIHVEPLRTVTLRFRNRRVPTHALLTGIGNFEIDDQTKQELEPSLQELLHTNDKVMRRVTVNSPKLNPSKFGTEAGIVSPFVRLGEIKDNPIACLLYYYSPKYKGFVEIATSFNNRIVISQAVFWQTLRWWNAEHLGIPSKQVFRTRVL